jgi:hypothetical protein
VVRDAADKAQFRLRAAQCQTNARQRKVLERLLANGLLRVEGVGKATRYAVNVPGWEQPATQSTAQLPP